MVGFETYFDFAENDYILFKKNYELSLFSNGSGAIAQNICERYLKHIIDTYADRSTKEKENEVLAILRTHSLRTLLNFIKRKFKDFSIDDSAVKSIDGFYFSTRYPGGDSVILTKDDFDECMIAVNACRNSVISFMKKHPVFEYCPQDMNLFDLPKKKTEK